MQKLNWFMFLLSSVPQLACTEQLRCRMVNRFPPLAPQQPTNSRVLVKLALPNLPWLELSLSLALLILLILLHRR